MTDTHQKIPENVVRELRALEESLWRADSRFDDALMDQTFAADFEEFGRSGRRYERAQMLFGEDAPITIPAILPLQKFTIRMLRADMALVTYVSELHYDTGEELANRSSIWHRKPDGWKLRFHQGTPTTREHLGDLDG